MSLKRFLAGTVLASAALYSHSASAAFTYNYIGNSYTQSYEIIAPGLPYITNNSLLDTSFYGSKVTGSITFTQDIPSNFTGYFQFTNGRDVALFSLSSGNVTVQNLNAQEGALSFHFTNGNIDEWDFVAGSQSYGGFELKTSHTTKPDVSADLFNTDYIQYTYFNEVTATRTVIGNRNVGDPGTWRAVPSVPLPSSLPMFSAALFGLIGIGVKSRRKVTAR